LRSKWAEVFVFQEIEQIPAIDNDQKIAVISQTTLNFDHVQSILQNIKQRYPHAIIPKASDVCKATCDRQSVILQNLNKFETFIVIGGKESNNTKELYEIWIRHKKQTFYGESLADIVQTAHNELFTHETVAVTGWASTPQEDIQEVVDFFVTNGYKQEILLLK
jgi:4-hydroxy-3-methylbut-2-enyl diphosphate reductase